MFPGQSAPSSSPAPSLVMPSTLDMASRATTPRIPVSGTGSVLGERLADLVPVGVQDSPGDQADDDAAQAADDEDGGQAEPATECTSHEHADGDAAPDHHAVAPLSPAEEVLVDQCLAHRHDLNVEHRDGAGRDGVQQWPADGVLP